MHVNTRKQWLDPKADATKEWVQCLLNKRYCQRSFGRQQWKTTIVQQGQRTSPKWADAKKKGPQKQADKTYTESLGRNHTR